MSLKRLLLLALVSLASVAYAAPIEPQLVRIGPQGHVATGGHFWLYAEAHSAAELELNVVGAKLVMATLQYRQGGGWVATYELQATAPTITACLHSPEVPCVLLSTGIFLPLIGGP